MKELHLNKIADRTKDWRRDKIAEIPIEIDDDPLLSLAYLPEKIILSPQYFIQGLPGSRPELYARSIVLDKLRRASHFLPKNYKFVIFDAWRSLKTQQFLFDRMNELVKQADPTHTAEQIRNAALRIVALPSRDAKKPSPHNIGAAIDLSIADDKGRLLPMGSPFDDISPAAKSAFYENKDGKEEKNYAHNRRLLYTLLSSQGFSNYPEEWWHFEYGDQNWAFATKQQKAIFGPVEPNFPWKNDF